MSENIDLEQVITDSVNDAVGGFDDSEPVADDTPAVEAVPEPSSDGTAEAIGEETLGTTQVTAPGGQAEEAKPEDPLAAELGPQMGITGRENRIPYSRVKKISEKAAVDAETKIAETVLGRKLTQGEKAADAVKAHIGQIPQLTSKVQDYEGRLTTVGAFENVMANDSDKFLGMLTKLPAYAPERMLSSLAKLPEYKSFFQFVEQAYNTMNAVAPNGQPAQLGDMPQPDEKLPDGSAVYSMNGLRNLVSWVQTKTKQDALAEASRQFNERYGVLEKQYSPILQAWKEHQIRESVRPVIQAQIAEARTWPMFNELEGEITKVLERDKTISLEAAYRQVAFPKVIAERNTMRQDILKELKAAPVSTSVAGRANVRPNAPTPDGPRSIEDVIREQVESLKGQ